MRILINKDRIIEIDEAVMNDREKNNQNQPEEHG